MLKDDSLILDAENHKNTQETFGVKSTEVKVGQSSASKMNIRSFLCKNPCLAIVFRISFAVYLS